MAFRRVKDVSVVTGTYEQNGETKNRYKQVGVAMKGDDGSSFILLDRSFNPAGVPHKPGDDKILLSLFDPREENGTATRPATAPARTTAPAPVGDDDIPF